ncbi:MAG: methyltransferase domain-containing protein [Alphaproteobacteria bacterium]
MLFLEKTYGATLKDQRILHVAPEWGLYQYLRRARITHYTPSDLDLYRYRHIRDVKKVDCTSLPFPDNSYDLIICSHVMEHIPDERAALSEFYRVLGPNGRAILQVPLALDRAETDEDPAVTTPEAREARFCQWDHVRLYGRDYASRLETVGFKAEFFNPFEQYADEAETLHLNPLEELYVVRRPGA